MKHVCRAGMFFRAFGGTTAVFPQTLQCRPEIFSDKIFSVFNVHKILLFKNGSTLSKVKPSSLKQPQFRI